ncbi:MAG TPA: hypothetical protein ENG92_00365, partial [Thiolapillus brandeum]|nr:hypothetical protein [Thiolapillus brandeum]
MWRNCCLWEIKECEEARAIAEQKLEAITQQISDLTAMQD